MMDGRDMLFFFLANLRLDLVGKVGWWGTGFGGAGRPLTRDDWAIKVGK